MSATNDAPAGRSGQATRARIRQTALQMFTERGFEGTSIKDLADELGITKSALYYHFASKDAIVQSLIEDRQAEIEELLAWVQVQPASADLVVQTALRWVDGLTAEAIAGMRFARANRPAMHRLSVNESRSPFAFNRIIDALVPAGATDVERLRVMLPFEAGTAAVLAADGLDVSDAEVLAAARSVVQRLTDENEEGADGRS